MFSPRQITALIRPISGGETTRMLISTEVLRLLEHPDQLAAVRADASLIEPAVDEALRHSGPAKGLFRKTLVDVEIGGAAIPKDQIVQVMFLSANHDPAQFEHPEVFDLFRSGASNHLTFGKGIHFCLGAHLAQLQGKIALERILARLPGLRLAGGASSEWDPSAASYGLTRLDVAWDV
jgi:cytochrome P450